MKILVTGANGYIGSNVIRLLLDQGHTVIACDVSTGHIDPRAIIIQRDIFSGLDDDMYMALCRPDICLHLAWRDGFVHNSTSHLHDLPLHFAFLTNLIDHGLKHLAVMGTMHEVGYYEGKIDENTPCRPLSLYAISKNALRQSIMLYAERNECIIQWIRGFYIYGDDNNNHSVFTKLLEASARGDEYFPFTSGRNQYDFMHVSELVNQIAATIVQDKVDGIINCCTGKPQPLSDVVQEFIRSHDLNIKLKYGAFPDRQYDSPCIYGDNTKITRILTENNA